MKMINMMGHKVDFCTPEGEHLRTIEPCGLVVRVDMKNEVVKYMDEQTGIPCFRVSLGKPYYEDLEGKEVWPGEEYLDVHAGETIGIIVSRNAAESLWYVEQDDYDWNEIALIGARLKIDISVFAPHKSVFVAGRRCGAEGLSYFCDLDTTYDEEESE